VRSEAVANGGGPARLGARDRCQDTVGGGSAARSAPIPGFYMLLEKVHTDGRRDEGGMVLF